MHVSHIGGRCLLFLLINVLTLSQGLFTSQQLLNGSLTIAGLFELQTVGSDGKCGEVQVASVMAMEAVRWYIQSVNDNQTLPFQIGFSVYKTCGNLGHAGDAAVDIMCRYRRSDVTDSSEGVIIGVIGPKYSSETQVVSSILGSQTTSDRFLQIGFSSTSTELNDRVKYPNYYRVVTADDVQITAMLQLMFDLKWNRIAIIFVNDTYGWVGANMLQKYSSGYDICISKMDAIDIDSSRQVDASKIREILNTYILEAPSIEGVVYIGNEEVANQLLQIFDSLQMSDVPIFLLSELNLDTDIFKSATGNVLPKTKGTLALALPYIEDTEFKMYWESLFLNKTALQSASAANPYLYDVFRQYKGCDFDLPSCGALNQVEIREKAQQSVYVHYSIFAAHTLIKTLSKVYETLCTGGCNTINEFKTQFKPNHLVEAMDGLSVTYGGIRASFMQSSPNVKLADGETEYEVYNFRKEPNSGSEFALVKVGRLSSEHLVLETDKIKDYGSDGSERHYPNIRKGQCRVGRKKCTECINNDISEISYHIPGDFYIIGIISINNRAIPGPIGCGTVRTRHGYQMYLSLQFALDEFKTRRWYALYKEMFVGKSIGLIVINSCNNALEVVPKILQLHSKGLRLPDGTHLDLTNRILGYVGGQAADVTEPAAAQLTKLGIVQISYTTTNPVLSNKELYPYFMRVVTPDNVQAMAMIDIVKELKGEYIQLVYSEGAYGEGGRDSILSAADDAKICITQKIMVKEKDTYFEYFELLRRKPHAKIVIVFLRSHVVDPFMRDLDKDMSRGQFQFIGSEAWGKNADVLAYDITKGAIITAMEMDKDRNLDQFILSQKPEYNVSNPWLEDYIQSRQDCYYSWSYDKTFSRECTDDILPISDPNFESDPWCIFVSNTMLAFLKGAAVFYSNQCGSSTSNQLCPDFVEKPEEFIKVLRNVKMDIYGTGEILIFDEKGDGLTGYKIYNIHDGPIDKTARVYSQVGLYNPKTGLQLEKNNVIYPTDEPFSSSCPSVGACFACFPDDLKPTPQPSCKDEQSAVVPGLGALAGVLAVVIIILCVLLWCKIRRNTSPAIEDPYLNPTYLEKRPTTEGEHSESENAYVTANPSFDHRQEII